MNARERSKGLSPARLHETPARLREASTPSGAASALLLSLLLAACAEAADESGTRPADLIGTWRIPIVEVPSPDGSASAFARRTVVFTDDAESVSFEAFANPEATMALFTYASSGPYTVVGAAPGIDRALALDLTNDRSEVTIFVDAPDLWRAIGLERCPLRIGEAVEIADCVSGPPFRVADCVDRDVVKVDRDGRRLRFGGGEGDRCETRPTVLDEEAYTRAD